MGTWPKGDRGLGEQDFILDRVILLYIDRIQHLDQLKVTSLTYICTRFNACINNVLSISKTCRYLSKDMGRAPSGSVVQAVGGKMEQLTMA